jgi:hypothetical protein
MDRWARGPRTRRVLRGRRGSSSGRRGSSIMGERHLTVQRQVAASPDSVWGVCADFPNLADHWDGLRASRPIGDQTHGVGARRQVDLKPVGSMVETITAWEEGRTVATANQPSALVPFKQAESRLTLEPEGDGTAITFDYRYVPKGGPARSADRPRDRQDAEDDLRGPAGRNRGNCPQSGLAVSREDPLRDARRDPPRTARV